MIGGIFGLLFLVLIGMLICGIGGFVLVIFAGMIAKEQIEWSSGAKYMFVTWLVFVLSSILFSMVLGWGSNGWHLAGALAALTCGVIFKTQTGVDWKPGLLTGVAAGGIMMAISIGLSIAFMPAK